MATREFIEKRIQGKEKEIAKLQKKLERIRKAEATNWEVNPYYYNENDKRWTERDLQNAFDSLEQHKADLQVIIEKEASRNVTAILKFLENWKANCIKFYTAQRKIYKEVALPEYYAEDEEYCNKWNSGELRRMSKEERTAYEKEHREYVRDFRAQWAHVTQFEHGDRTWEENLERDLEAEKNRKYDFIIDRTNATVGQITDASGLTIGAKGDLNGLIKGTKSTAKVQTIGAGGYNIQIFHFRTLINELK